ncbi:MAG: hypothetical protein LBJ44_11630 [Propionibacteriaceae bacterium]|jgi:hypothetical protein|nr:hypothetical protein [Propionibacteriaceae bacterium]
MARTVADPAALRQLAHTIKQAADDMERIATGLGSALAAADWQDEVRRRFESDLNELVRTARSFKGPAQVAVNFLEKKARDLDTYLS